MGLDMDMKQLLLTGGLLAGGTAIASFWGQIKSFFQSIISWFIVTIELEDQLRYGPRARHFTCAIEIYLYKHFKEFPFGNKAYKGIDAFVKKLNKKLLIAYKKVGRSQTVLFFKGWAPIWYSQNHEPNARHTTTLSYIRGTLNIEQLLQRCIDNYNEVMSQDDLQRFSINYVTGKDTLTLPNKNGYEGEDDEGVVINSDIHKNYKLLKYSHEDIGFPKLAADSYIIINEMINDALEEAKFWKSNEPWYISCHIPYKRGWMLHGRPGTGKTMLAKTVAEMLDLPVYVFDLATLGNKEFREGYNLAAQNAPACVVIEEIDTVFHGRKNILSSNSFKSNLTFDCLLTCIDGMQQSHGIFLIITTNNIDKVDPALAEDIDPEAISSRPGRIDRIIRIPELDRQAMLRVCERVLKDDKEGWEPLITLGLEQKDTIIKFIERCSRKATKRKFTEKTQEKL